jgi:hypothetical protein
VGGRTNERAQTMRTVIYRRLNISISRGCWRIHVRAYVLRHLLCFFSHQLPVTNKRRRARIAKCPPPHPNELEKLMKNLRCGGIRSSLRDLKGPLFHLVYYELSAGWKLLRHRSGNVI